MSGEAFPTSHNLPSNVIEAAMPYELQEDAMLTATLLLKKVITFLDLEASLKSVFDQTYGPRWDCFVGYEFVFYVRLNFQNNKNRKFPVLEQKPHICAEILEKFV
jgi:Dynein light chain type 1